MSILLLIGSLTGLWYIHAAWYWYLIVYVSTILVWGMIEAPLTMTGGVVLTIPEPTDNFMYNPLPYARTDIAHYTYNKDTIPEFPED